jgi:hypothetical protein
MKLKLSAVLSVGMLCMLGLPACRSIGKAQELPKSVIIVSENKTADQVELFQVAIDDALRTLTATDELTLGEVKGNGIAKRYSSKVVESDIQDAIQDLQPSKSINERALVEALASISQKCRNTRNTQVRAIVITEGTANPTILRQMRAIVEKDLVQCPRLVIAFVGLSPDLSDATVSPLHAISDRAKSGRKAGQSMSDSITTIHDTLE